MERPSNPWTSKTIVLATTLIVLIALVPAHASGPASWKVTLQGSDVTGAAAPIDRGSVPSINITSLSPALGIAVSTDNGVLSITDTIGTDWKAMNGALALESGLRSIRLTHPLLVQGNAAYISVDAVAEVARVDVKIDRKARRVDFSPTVRSVGTVGDGWESFTLDKSPSERLELLSLAPKKSYLGRGSERDMLLPPVREKVRANLGVGYVQDAHLGTDFSLSGRVLGREVNLGTMFTLGRGGLRSQGGRLSVLDRDMGWGAEAGGIQSDIWGYSRGLRYSWLGKNDRWPSISVYAGDSSHKPVVAYRDEARLGDMAAFGGEIATDGSMLLKTRLQDGTFGVFGYHRSTPARVGNGNGAFVSLNLGRNLSLYGGASTAVEDGGERKWHSVSLRMPLYRGFDLILERSATRTGLSGNSTNAAMLTMPVGPLRVVTRYQKRDGGRLQVLPYTDWVGFASREMMTSAAYTASSRLSLDLQMSTRREAGAGSESWQQLVSLYKVSPTTQVQTISAFPSVLNLDDMRVRIQHDLGDGKSLSMDYGRLSAYSSDKGSSNRGFKLMFQKKWNLDAPARGGEVYGRVADRDGRGLGDVVVKLGKYRALTNERGEYCFKCVPRGDYSVTVDRGSLPADYTVGNGERVASVRVDSRENINLSVMPLNSIEGRVFCDRDGDGEYDAGEGVDGIVVRRGEFATATGNDGAFGFYNMEPGIQTVLLDSDRLPVQYVKADTGEQIVNVGTDAPAVISFRVANRVKEIVFQDLK